GQPCRPPAGRRAARVCRTGRAPGDGQRTTTCRARQDGWLRPRGANRGGVAERFPDPAVPKSVEVDLALIDFYDQLLRDVELTIVQTAQQHDAQTLYRLQSVPGIGQILRLVLLSEIHDSTRFPRGQDFVSY